MLKPLLPEDVGKKCLVLDLDETLVHSSFKAVPQADFVIPVEIEGQTHNVYVLKRPQVDLFLQKMGPLFEIVVFTASLAKVPFKQGKLTHTSTQILFWTFWIPTKLSSIDYLEKRASITREITSRI